MIIEFVSKLISFSKQQKLTKRIFKHFVSGTNQYFTSVHIFIDRMNEKIPLQNKYVAGSKELGVRGDYRS